MHLGVGLFLARRGLRENLLSTVLMIAVAVAVGFQIPSAANLLGYPAELLADALDAGSGDVRVRPLRGNTLRDAVALAARLTRFARVTEPTPFVTAPASIKANGLARNLGVPSVDPRATYHPYHLAAGQALGDAGDGVLFGTATANALGVGIGDEIELRVLLSTYPRLLLDDSGYGSTHSPSAAWSAAARRTRSS